MRVWELAEELGVTSTEVLDLIRSYDPYVTSHLATVPRQAIDGIRAAPPAPHSATPTRPVGDPPPSTDITASTRQPPRTSTPPARQPPKRRRRPGPAPVTFEPPFDNEDPYDDPTGLVRYEPTWSTRDVATFFHVTPATVRQWVRRGHLTPIGTVGPSHIFDRDNVLDVVPQIEDRRRARAQPRTPPPTPPPSSHPDPWDTYLAQRATDARREPRGRGYAPTHTQLAGLGTRALARLAAVRPDTRVTTREAATLLGLTPATIRSWIHRGHLTSATPGTPTALTFRLADLYDTAHRRSRTRKGAPVKPP